MQKQEGPAPTSSLHKAIRQEAEAPTPSIWPKLSLEWDPL